MATSTTRKKRKAAKKICRKVNSKGTKRTRKVCRPVKKKRVVKKPIVVAPVRPPVVLAPVTGGGTVVVPSPAAPPVTTPPAPPPAPPPQEPPTAPNLPVYNGTFGVAQAQRLLWRAGFGPSPARPRRSPAAACSPPSAA